MYVIKANRSKVYKLKNSKIKMLEVNKVKALKIDQIRENDLSRKCRSFAVVYPTV